MSCKKFLLPFYPHHLLKRFGCCFSLNYLAWLLKGYGRFPCTKKFHHSLVFVSLPFSQKHENTTLYCQRSSLCVRLLFNGKLWAKHTHAEHSSRSRTVAMVTGCIWGREYARRLLASLTWTAHTSGWWSLNPIAVNLLWKLYLSDKEQRVRGEEETGAEGWEEQRGVVDWQKLQWKVLIVVFWHNVRNPTCYTRRTPIGVEINVLFILNWKRKVCG